MAACAVAVFVYARWVEPRRLEIRSILVPMDAPGATELRILHLTDFHLSPEVPLSHIRRAIELGVQEKPDLICLTGDYITDDLEQEAAYADALSRLPRTAPTFAVAGNHDGGIWAREHGGYSSPEEVAGVLRKAGIVYLANEMAEVTVRGRRVAIAGLGDLWAGNSRPEAVAGPLDRSPADLRILLVHNPDAKESTASLRWDLMLAGHTHGGQLILPMVGAPFAPVRDKSMIKGLYSWQGRKIHISPGVGNVAGMRIFSPPEISILRIPL